jgi:hypothetical protein
MERHLELLFRPARGKIDHLIEFRALGSSYPKIWTTTPGTDEIDKAITRAIEHNEEGYNVYVMVNPVYPIKLPKPRPSNSANDNDIICAYYAFADADTEESSVRLRYAAPHPTFIVVTGTQPFERLHAYWKLEEAIDLTGWRELQTYIIRAMGTDRSIINPSRIMRLAGSVTYPDKAKRDRGYCSELVRLEVTK